MGSLLCCQRTNFLKKILIENKEAVYFSSSKECYMKCKNLLKNPGLLKKISKSGNAKVTKTLNVNSENIFKKIFNYNFLIKNNKKIITKI